MYSNRFYSISNILNKFVLQTRHFARTTPNVNKVTLYLQRAKLIDSIRLSLRSNSPDNSLVTVLSSPALDSFVVTNALRAAPSPDSALFLVETLKEIPHFSHTQHTLYALAKILANSGQVGKLGTLINAINSGKFINVARVSFLDRMRWYSAGGDLDKVFSIWDEWRKTLDKHPCTESYNIIMGLYVQKGMDSEAVKVFRRMIEEGGLPNSRTYTVMIEHLVKSRKLDSAMEVFRILPLMRIKRTLRQYAALVNIFTATDQLDLVKTLLHEMRSDGILPGQAMQLSLQQMRELGNLEEMEELVMEIIPDARIKTVSYSLYGTTDSSEDDIDDGEEDTDGVHGNDKDEVQLKPWLDPAALASALQHWGSEEVSALENANFVWTTRLVCKFIRSFKSAETAWQFFCWVTYQPGFTHDIYTISRMITKLARHGCVHLVDQLLFKIQREGMKLSFSTIRLVIDFYGITGKGDAALKNFRSVKTFCSPISQKSMLLLYSSLLRTLAKCKMNTEALDILDEMILLGISPDIQIFTGLMHHYALQGDIKTVQRLFGMVKQSDLEPDAYMYKVLIRAYCKCERAALALRIFDDMMNSGLMPDSATKDMLVKSLWKEGKLREAAAVEEKSEQKSYEFPVALPGHMYTVSNADLIRVHDIYSESFTTTEQIVRISQAFEY